MISNTRVENCTMQSMQQQQPHKMINDHQQTVQLCASTPNRAAHAYRSPASSAAALVCCCTHNRPVVIMPQHLQLDHAA
jgi:hypothetical protein